MDAPTAFAGFAADPRLGDLAALQQRSQPFNIVSALGLSRQELRHSALLAYLLDQRNAHGLGTLLLRAMLRQAVSLLLIDLDVDALRLDQVTVQREWQFIDILIESPTDRLAIIIENKIDTTEHSDQLRRYHTIVRNRWQDWTVAGIYLTLDATPPEKPTDRATYAAIGYGDLAAMLGDLAADGRVEGAVQMLLQHYATQIRSELMHEPDADTASLARALYLEHRTAFDAMLHARDARMDMIRRLFDGLLLSAKPHDLLPDSSYFNDELTRRQTRFAPKEWYRPDLQVSTSWTRTKLIMVFDFLHSPKHIHLTLTVGPASGAEPLRQALYDLAVHRVAPFFPAWNTPAGTWFNIYSRTIFADDSDYFATAPDEQIRTTIRRHWGEFVAYDLPAIRATIQHQILDRAW